MPATSAAIHAAHPVPMWRRFACMLYDLLPLAGLWFAAAGLWLLAFHGAYDPLHSGCLRKALLDAWLLVVTGAYFVLSWVRVGQTIGMRAWKLKLLRVDGTRVGVGRASARFALASLSLLSLGAGFWYAWFDREHRTWHDRVCGTRVAHL